tara:strand:- start:2748 stop:3515 length:768 start_codon:yes stop_codon:yes gene_type:complete
MKPRIFFQKNIFNIEEVKRIRDYFKNKDFFNKELELTILDKNNFLSEVIFSKNLLKKISDVFGEDVYFIDDFIIQKNNRTFIKEKYHKDSGKIHQSNILSDKNNMYGKIGINLQDNIKDIGGGIDYLKPLFFDNFSDRNKLLNKLRAFYFFLRDKLCDTHLPTKAGDLIYFSAMLSHRTSITKNKNNLIQDKYVIYCQLTNLNTIKKVLKIVRSLDTDIEFQEIKNEINVVELNGFKVKILNKKISSEVGSYMGL